MFRLLSLSEFISALLAGLIASLCSIGLMGTAAWLITKAALQPPLYALTLGITGVRACGIGRAVFRYLDRWLSHRMAFHFYAKLQARLYRQAEVTLPMKAGIAKQGAFLELLTKGCAMLRDFWLRVVLPPIVTFLLTLTGVYALSASIGIFSWLLLLLWSLHLFLPRFFLKTETKKEATAAYRSLLLDTQAGIDELFCAQQQNIATNRLYDTSFIMQKVSASTEKRQDFCNAILDICDGITLLSFFALLYAQSLSIIELGVWLLLLMALINEFRPLSAASHNYMEAQPAKKQLFSHITKGNETYPQVTKPCKSDLPYLLSVKNLSFSYRQGNPIFSHLSFQIKKGQHTAIIGESGAGKTTLGYLLAGLWQPDAGTIQKNGELVAALQGSFLFSASIRENFLRLYPQIDESAIQQALTIAQLTSVVEQMPQGIDTSIGTDGCYLSGGQRTRLLTALTLPSSAPLILLDEPTAGLDAQTSQRLVKALLAHVQQTKQTLLLITHDMSLAQQMPQQICLS